MKAILSEPKSTGLLSGVWYFDHARTVFPELLKGHPTKRVPWMHLFGYFSNAILENNLMVKNNGFRIPDRESYCHVSPLTRTLCFNRWLCQIPYSFSR